MSSSSSVLRLDEAKTAAGEWSLVPLVVVGTSDEEEQMEEEERV